MSHSIPHSATPSIATAVEDRGKEEYDLEKTPASQEQEVWTVPDGGIQAWLSVIGGWLVLFCTLGYAQSFGVYEDLYVRSGASTPSNISWIGSFQLFMMFIIGLPAGKLYDAGYFHHTQYVGIFIFTFCLFMLSLVDTSKFYQIMLSQGVGVGMGMGLLFIPAISVQAQHWEKRRSLAMGIVITGSSFGGVVLPIMHNQLFAASAGFPWGVRASAFMMLGLLIIAKALMTTRLTPEQRPPTVRLGQIFRDVPFMFTVVGHFFILFGLYFPYFYMQLYVNVKRLSDDLAFYTLAIMNAGSVLGRTIPNYLADSWGRFNAFTPVALACTVLVFSMFGLKDIGGVIAFSVLYGFFSGAFISLGPPLLATVIPDVKQIGIYLGVAYFITSWAILTGNPICGQLVGDTFEWWKAIVFCGVMMLVGSLFILWARTVHSRKVGSQRI